MRRYALDYRAARDIENKLDYLIAALTWRSGPCVHGERRAA
jgi:hypothetical protein